MEERILHYYLKAFRLTIIIFVFSILIFFYFINKEINLEKKLITIDKGDTIGMYSLQSLLPEINMMVDDKGKWLGNYIPARYRSLPFVLAACGIFGILHRWGFGGNTRARPAC